MDVLEKLMKILFNGNIERLNSYDIIKNIVYKEKLNLLYPDTNLVDTGSLIWIWLGD